MLTKSDFLIYLDSPLHLWAKKNNQYTKELSPYNKHLIKQGYEVEALAREYVRKYINKDAIYQKEYKTEELLSKGDIVVGKDIYEVKSTTSIDKEHRFDVCFQYYTASKTENIEKIYLIYLNKEYVREGDIDLKELFIIEDMTEYVKENLHTVEGLIEEAILVTELKEPKGLLECYKPKDCPCINLCHPNLPEYSIYNIANADEKKLRTLRDMGILDIKDIPKDFKLSEKQLEQVRVARENIIYKNIQLIQKDLQDLKYPIHFLDYETYSWAVPQYNNHKAYQFVVFQYSLHILNIDGVLTHKEYLCITTNDPIKEILESLQKDIKGEGSILVWNKSFEMSCNKEMARIYPEYESFIEDINSRIYDLGDIFSKQMYIDPKFKGSWSIKNVLPVLVPTLTYKGMDISNGTEAMVNWEKIVYGKVEMKEREDIYDSLLKYCELDTLAMYEIYRYLLTLF